MLRGVERAREGKGKGRLLKGHDGRVSERCPSLDVKACSCPAFVMKRPRKQEAGRPLFYNVMTWKTFYSEPFITLIAGLKWGEINGFSLSRATQDY